MIRPSSHDQSVMVVDQDCVVVDEHLSAGKLAPVVRNLVLSVHVKDVGDGVVEHEVVSGNVVLTWSVT